ncbi:DNA methylase [Erythrobacter sp. SG61-1L]|uniref:DNA methyltransferase n=1 Tax=Erythrobacter sp. SG61-1L TaxID=1603897 RepID=UPI0006C91BA2|nr:DNA methyltransferase [Erythrobacter sp. SG61-1L]KPL67450.1 DNA methylase [Erythrobacter sp. SG61-1L]
MEEAITIGQATLYLGDAYAIRPTLGRMDVDVMDPPYRFNAVGAGKFRAARQATHMLIAEGMDKGFDHSIINPLLCGSCIVFFHPDQLLDLGDHLRGNFRRMVLCQWIKENPAPHRNKNYIFDSEPYFHAWNEGLHPVGAHEDMHRYVFAPVAPSKIYDHPTVKPDRVMAKIMANVNGQTICDPFMGTGSTGVAAIRAGKRFYGIEKNPKHFETACNRISAAVAEMEARAA